MKEKIEKFLEKRVKDLETETNETSELIIDHYFALLTALDSDNEGKFIFGKLLAKNKGDFYYEEVITSFTIDSIELVDDLAEYIIKIMTKIMEKENEETKAWEQNSLRF